MTRIATAGPRGQHLLVVDDDREMRRSTERLLRRRGFAVHAAADGPAALEALRRFPSHGMLLDWYLRDTTAEHLLPAIRALAPNLPILLVSGWATGERGPELVERLGLAGFHDKGEGAAVLLERVDALVGGGSSA